MSPKVFFPSPDHRPQFCTTFHPAFFQLCVHTGSFQAGAGLDLYTLQITMEPLASQQGPSILTAVYFLQREVLLQVPPEFHLISILSQGPIIRQDEVGVHAVECGELAEGVAQYLVQAHNLQDSEDEGGSELQVLPQAQLRQRSLCAKSSCQGY